MMTNDDARLANRILLGLVAGAALGALTLVLGTVAPAVLTGAQRLATTVLEPFGQIFLRLLFFVVVPLVFASLAAGVAQLGRPADLGPLALLTFGLFALNMAVGVGLGLLVMNVLAPGGQLDPATQQALTAEYGGAAQGVIERSAAQPGIDFGTLVDMFMPRNLVGAFVGQNRDAIGEVLPLILFAILVGAAATQLPQQKAAGVRQVLDTVTELMTRIVRFALLLAPLAVPALIFSVVVRVGFDILIALGLFLLGCLGVMALHLFGTMALWLRLGTRRSPRAFFREIGPVLVTAFSTSSSNATLPAALSVARERLRLRPDVSGFVLPLGATMNMSGTALYEGCVVLFVAQIFGVDLTLGQQLTLLVLSVMSAVAVAGIPGGSLPLIAGLLVTFGVPAEGIGIVLGVDRLLDMARTTVNVGADLVTATVVDERLHGTG